MQDVAAYSLTATGEAEGRIQFFFESLGSARIVKVIEYTAIRQAGSRVLYNLGFGDYDEESGQVSDLMNSNNGDMRRVFNTVLSTVPLFFATNPHDVIVVRGSDSDKEAALRCFATCRKGCVEYCKNADRRIRTYRYFVEKNFAALVREYVIFGSYRDDIDDFVRYVPGEDYVAILVYRKY